MSLISVFRNSGVLKENRSWISGLFKINAVSKDKIGMGIRLILSVVLIYIVITLITIYNLLVSL